MIRWIYDAQRLKTVKNDWSSIVQKDKIFYNIELSDESISEMSKNSYKKYIERKISNRSYIDFCEIRKTKIQDILKSVNPNKNGQIQMQKYLKSSELSKSEKQMLFMLRSHNLDCKSNFPNAFGDVMGCRTCGDRYTFEDEMHSLECPSLIPEEERDNSIKFEHIYGSLEEQIKAIKYFMKIINKLSLLLEFQTKNC